MDFVTACLVVVSCALICAGVWLVVRDLRASGWKAPQGQAGVPERGAAQAGVWVRSFDWRIPRRPQKARLGFWPWSRAGATEAQHDHFAATEVASEIESLARWQTFEPVLASALRAVNSAFAQAGAALAPDDNPAWDPFEGAHVLRLSVSSDGRDVGHMHIAASGAEIEVSASPKDARRGQVSRLRRLAPQAVNIQSIAEAVAACAWPIVAGDRGQGRAGR